LAISDTSISSADGVPVRLFVNRRLRSIKWPGVLGARIHAGTIRREAGGVGDTVIADLQRGFFAIADSSDRNPVFGRHVLQHLSAFMAGFTRYASGVIHTERAIEPLLRSITLESEPMLRSLPFHGTCTFTGLCLTMTDQGLGALLLHAGDTVLFKISLDGTMSLVTKKNFWFIGKSSAFFQIEFLRIEAGTRFLFATDGLHGLAPDSGEDVTVLAGEIVKQPSIEDVPDLIFGSCRIPESGADDIAVMSLDPALLLHGAVTAGPILLGGTTAYQERKRRVREKEMPDRYEPWDREESEHSIL
jgi:hypothetical protein